MLLASLLPEGAPRTGRGLLVDIVSGAVVGLLVGPVLGFVVGLVCLITHRLPRWLLDAPDYVAVATVVAVAAVVGLQLSTMDGLVLWLTVGCVALPPAIDAALVAPALLQPTAEPPPRMVQRRWLPAVGSFHLEIRLPGWLRLLPHR
jgi:MFS family permease